MALSQLPQLVFDEAGETVKDPKIIVALDFPEQNQALEFVRRMDPGSCRLKVGNELFTSAGPAFVEELSRHGFEVFLDLKYHDIPNTVSKAVSAAAKLGIWMLNVHALGGKDMMLAAREAVDSAVKRPYLVAVTVLTSLAQNDIDNIGIQRPLAEFVDGLTAVALQCGLDGVVCSAEEAPALRASVGQAPLLITPGIRPQWAAADDQQRIVTPQRALADGASYLVIGRPITRHEDPAEAIRLINASIA
jgi:orotidine-5'-phosphate decarboxylase